MRLTPRNIKKKWALEISWLKFLPENKGNHIRIPHIIENTAPMDSTE